MRAEANADLWALRTLGRAHRLRDWMFSVLAPRRPGPGVEIGAGIGTFSEALLSAGIDPLLVIEPDSRYAAELTSRFAGDERVHVAAEGVPDSDALAAVSGTCIYALCQNVLEHIEDDQAALGAIARALAPEGELALLVPAHPSLYGRLDRAFDHHRRYTRAHLRALVDGAGLELLDLRDFNLLGVPGWWLAGRTPFFDISDASLRAYEALVRVWRPIEDRFKPPFGLSLVARARKPGI